MEDQGIRLAYIKRVTPQLNGKVERSHRSDEQEFSQLLSYKEDVAHEAKLNELGMLLQFPPTAWRIQWKKHLTKRSTKSYNYKIKCPAGNLPLHANTINRSF